MNSLYPTNQNYNKTFSLLAIDEDKDDFEKMVFTNNRTPIPKETAYPTSVLKITHTEALTDASATGYFILPVTLVNFLKPSIKLILEILSKLMSTYMCEPDIYGIPEQECIAHIIPGLEHASSIYISVLCDDGFKDQYDESRCSVYFNKKIVWKGVR